MKKTDIWLLILFIVITAVFVSRCTYPISDNSLITIANGKYP